MVAESLDHELPTLERWQVRLHLLACDGCTNFKRQMGFLRASMKKLGEQ